MKIFGEFAANAFGGGKFIDGGFSDALDGAPVAEEELFAVLADAGAIVEDALGDAFFHEELMVAVGKAVGFIANALEESECAGCFR